MKNDFVFWVVPKNGRARCPPTPWFNAHKISTLFSRSPGHSHNAGRPDYPPLGRGNTLPMNGVNNYAELAYDEEEDTYDDDYEDYDQVRPIFELILFS